MNCFMDSTVRGKGKSEAVLQPCWSKTLSYSRGMVAYYLFSGPRYYKQHCFAELNYIPVMSPFSCGRRQARLLSRADWPPEMLKYHFCQNERYLRMACGRLTGWLNDVSVNWGVCILPVLSKLCVISALLVLLYSSQWERRGPSVTASCCVRGAASAAGHVKYLVCH